MYFVKLVQVEGIKVLEKCAGTVLIQVAMTVTKGGKSKGEKSWTQNKQNLKQTV